MAGATPPKIDDAPRSFIGVGSRELAITAAGLVGAILIYTTQMYTPLKIGLAILVAGACVGLAFGRDPKTGRKLETMAFQWLSFQGRDKFHQKGADYKEEKPVFEEKKPEKKEKPKKESKPLFEVPAIDLNLTFVFQLCSIAFLGVLISYLWGGGLSSEIFRFKSRF